MIGKWVRIAAISSSALLLGAWAGVNIAPRLHRHPPSHEEAVEPNISAPSPRSPVSTSSSVASGPVGSDQAQMAVPPAKLTRSMVVDLAERCAPSAPSAAMASIVQVESANRPLRIGVNGRHRRSYDLSNQRDAVDLADRLIRSGENVDLGIAQLNARNLVWLGLSLDQAFDPCLNIAAAARVMEAGYRAALKTSPSGQSILETAYSIYNTGHATRGVGNGYADAVQRAQ